MSTSTRSNTRRYFIQVRSFNKNFNRGILFWQSLMIVVRVFVLSDPLWYEKAKIGLHVTKITGVFNNVSTKSTPRPSQLELRFEDARSVCERVFRALFSQTGSTVTFTLQQHDNRTMRQILVKIKIPHSLLRLEWSIVNLSVIKNSFIFKSGTKTSNHAAHARRRATEFNHVRNCAKQTRIKNRSYCSKK